MASTDLPTWRLAKLAGAVLILASLFLPMTSCTSAPPDGAPPGTRPEVTYHWAWSAESWTDPKSYVIPVAFVWPTAAIALSRRARSRRMRGALAIAEPVLFAGTIYVVWAVSLFGDPAIGLFVAAIGLALYGLGWLIGAGQALRAWRARPHPA